MSHQSEVANRRRMRIASYNDTTPPQITHHKGKFMKVLAVVLSAAALLAAQSASACVPYNAASFDAAYISKALSSKAFQEKAYLLGSGSEARIVSVKKEGTSVNVLLNDDCGIEVKGKAVEPKEGERACMNFEFTAFSYCQ